jgi:hypothetical protein
VSAPETSQEPLQEPPEEVPEHELQEEEPQLQEGPPDPIRHNDRVLIVGKTEGGKTVLARHLALQFTGSRLTFIDPKDSGMQLGEAPAARTPAELDLQAPVSHYVPTTLSQDEYEELFDLLWRARGPRVIWLDEAYGPTDKGYAPRGLRHIVQQGRIHDMGLIACSQRPVNIEATLRTEAEHVIIFVPSPPMLDIRTLAGDIGKEPDELKRELESLLQDEGLFSHLWYCRRTGHLHRCAPLPADWA